MMIVQRLCSLKLDQIQKDVRYGQTCNEGQNTGTLHPTAEP